MAKIEPDRKTLARWAAQVPITHDQIFLPAVFKKKTTQGLEVKKIGPKRSHWGLPERTWYAYTLNQAHSRVVLAASRIEKLPADQLKQLLEIQRRIGNPAILPSKQLPARIRAKERFTWITAKTFRGLTSAEKILVLRAWTKAHRLTGIYPHLSPTRLPKNARLLLRKKKLLSLVNTFAHESGPNCLAAAAYALTGKHLKVWMHAPPFFKILKKSGFKLVKENPMPGDILLCRKNGKPVHAAFYLGKFVFEKPGQDFYEPYRLVSLSSWQKDWAHTRREIWRKKP